MLHKLAFCEDLFFTKFLFPEIVKFYYFAGGMKLFLVKNKIVKFKCKEVISAEQNTEILYLTQDVHVPWSSFSADEGELEGGHETRSEKEFRKKVLADLASLGVQRASTGQSSSDSDSEPELDGADPWSIRLSLWQHSSSNEVSVCASGELLRRLSLLLKEPDSFRIGVRMENFKIPTRIMGPIPRGNRVVNLRELVDGNFQEEVINGDYGVQTCGVIKFSTREMELVTNGTTAKCSQEGVKLDDEQSPVAVHLASHRSQANVGIGSLTIELLTDATKFMDFGGLENDFSFLRNLLEKDLLKDFSIVAENGVQVSCHKMILAAQSSVFEAMFQVNTKEMKENKVKLRKEDGLSNPKGRGVSEESIRALLAFLYHRCVDVPGKHPLVCVELLEVGHVYDILPLEAAMKMILMEKRDSWFSADSALEAHRFTSQHAGESNENLMDKLLNVLELKSKEDLNKSAVCKRLFPQSAAREMFISALRPKRARRI